MDFFKGCLVALPVSIAMWGIDKNDVLLKIFPANWARFKKAAGHYRNAEMAEYCDSAIIIWDMVSPGSLNMIDNMRRVSKPYLVYTIENNKLKEIKNVGF